MANDRKEPTLSSSPLSGARTNQSASSASQRAEKPVKTRSAARPKAPSRPVAEQVAPAKSNSLMVFVVFLLSLIALAIAAYNVWQLQQANSTILDQQARIVELEKKLTVADDASSQSITSLAANFLALNDDVKLSLTEIDKLWATRNVNKNSISENEKKIETIEQQAQTTRNNLSGIDKKITDVSTTTTQLSNSTSTQIKTITEQLLALNDKADTQTIALNVVDEKITTLAKANDDLERLAQNVKTQTAQQEITLQSLRERVAAGLSTNNAQPSAATTTQINQLAAQVRENQEAVRAIDAFRITVNRELLLLKQRAPAAQ